MPPKTYTEDTVQAALHHIEATGESQCQTAFKFGVPQDLLSRRLKTNTSTAQAHDAQRKLPADQESRVITWILRQEELSYAPTHSQVRAVVKSILLRSGLPEAQAVVRNNWVDRFLARHKQEIHTKRGRR